MRSVALFHVKYGSVKPPARVLQVVSRETRGCEEVLCRFLCVLCVLFHVKRGSIKPSAHILRVVSCETSLFSVMAGFFCGETVKIFFFSLID